METVSVSELKSRFSEVLERVRKGERIIISYGRKRQKIAVLLPYDRYASKQERKIGLLSKRGACIIHKGFKLTDEEFLSS